MWHPGHGRDNSQRSLSKSVHRGGIQPFVPSETGQRLVMKIIYEGVKGGNPIDYNDFIKIEGELAANGCEAAIMACTELSCFKEMYRALDYYIDAMEVLAAKSIQVCGRKLKRRKEHYKHVLAQI